jgi:hypothetical protein
MWGGFHCSSFGSKMRRALIRRLPGFTGASSGHACPRFPKPPDLRARRHPGVFIAQQPQHTVPDAAIDLQQAEGATYGAEAIQHLDQVGAAHFVCQLGDVVRSSKGRILL